MNEREFCVWLNGFVEMNPNAMVTGTQWQIIKDHLALIFDKVTPVRITPKPEIKPFPSVGPALPGFQTPIIGQPWQPNPLTPPNVNWPQADPYRVTC